MKQIRYSGIRRLQVAAMSAFIPAPLVLLLHSQTASPRNGAIITYNFDERVVAKEVYIPAMVVGRSSGSHWRTSYM